VFHYILGYWRENADMSNVKNSYNGIRLIRKGCNRKVDPLCVNAASKECGNSYYRWVYYSKLLFFGAIISALISNQEINIIRFFF